MSVPGTARSVITVGAVDAKRPVRVGSFSSFGPTQYGPSGPTCAPPVWASRPPSATAATASSRWTARGGVAGAVALLL